MNKFFYLLTALLFLGFVSVNASSVTTTLSSDSLEIGDLLKLTTTLIIPKDAIVTSDDEEILSDPIVVKDMNLARFSGDNSDTLKYFYTITTYDYDTMTINPITYIIREDTVIVDTVKSDVYRLRLISSIVADSGDTVRLKEILPPVKAGKLSLLWHWNILGIIALACLGYFLWKIYRKKNQIEIIPQKPAFIEAMELIEALDKEELIEKGELRKFVFKLSEILKKYTGRRYFVNFAELTTDEIIDWLPHSVIHKKQSSKLEKFFRGTHLIKFAGDTPGIAVARDLREEAVDFIKSTKPIDEIEEISNREKENREQEAKK